MDKKEICNIIDLLTDAGYDVEYIGVDKFPKPPSEKFLVKFTRKAIRKSRESKGKNRR